MKKILFFEKGTFVSDGLEIKMGGQDAEEVELTDEDFEKLKKNLKLTKDFKKPTIKLSEKDKGGVEHS